MKKLGALLAAFCLLFTLTACGGEAEQLSLSTMEVQAYEHPSNGAAITLPAAWEKLSEADEATVFAAADDSISLTLARELGGFSYYSVDGLAELAEELAGGVLADTEVLQSEVLAKPKGAVLVTVSGEVAEGEPAVCEVVVYSPLPAVRYYTVAVAGADAYQANAGLLREIYAGFHLNKTEDEIYQQLEDTNA